MKVGCSKIIPDRQQIIMKETTPEPKLANPEEGPKEFFARSKNGVEVFIDMKYSHASTHLAKNPKLAAHVKEFIADLNITDDHIRVDHDTGEEVGRSDLVETSDDDEVVYALRKNRSLYSRFVKNKEAAKTSWITVDIKKGDDAYYLYTAFVGRLTPSFPGGSYLPEQSKEFWSKHALVWGNQDIVPGTETKDCPW